MIPYNATVYRLDPSTGTELGVFVAAVAADGRMLRSNAVQGTPQDGTPAYDAVLRQLYPGSTFRIVRDGCDGYRRRLKQLALPPDYRR
jgi:hypothetical protein